MHSTTKILLAWLLAATAPGALAQDKGGLTLFDDPALGGSGSAQEAKPSFGDSRDVVDVAFQPLRESAPPGAIVPVAVIFDIEKNWHIWTNEGGSPEGAAIFDGAIWTSIDGADQQGISLDSIQWPAHHLAKADVGDGPRDYAVFDGKSVVFVNLQLDATLAVDSTSIALSAEFQACDDSTCLAPTFDPPTQTIKIAIDRSAPKEVPATGIFTTWKRPETTTGSRGSLTGGERPTTPSRPKPTPQQPNDAPDGAAPTDVPTDSNIDDTPESEPTAEPAPATASGSTFFGFSVPKTDGILGMIVLILMGIAGGFILNLTPCVLPVIPIKIMTISEHAKTPGRALTLGTAMAIGVFAFWLVIGLPVAFLSTFTDPSIIFGIWWITLGIGILIGAMGVGIMGLFTLSLPQSAYMFNPKADNLWGSFLFGVMTAVLGLPCFGFVAGALLAGTATLPPIVTLLIFGSIGVGMALPYFVLAVRPSWAEKIPRTGPASELVKQVMGLLLLAAAAYFIGAGLIGLTAEMPWMTRQIHWWAISFTMIVAGGWLALRTFQITSRIGPRISWLVVALVFAAVPTWFAVRSTDKAYHTWVELADVDSGSATSFSTKVWNPYTPARLEAARMAGKIVVVDFTAEWCLNCKALKAAVLDVNPVKSRLADDPHVVTFTADNTARSAPGWQLMTDLGQTGIPLLAIWGPDDPPLEPWQSNAYTSTQVIDAINEREPAAKDPST